MKKIIMSAIILGMSVMHVNAQGIGINATGASPDNSAMLDVASPTGVGLQMGILFPRVDLVTGITSPATHLFAVNTSLGFNAGSRFNSGLGLYRYDGTRWNRLLESTDSTMFWGTRGNSITSGDFLGTTNSNSLRFFTNNTERMFIPIAASDYIEATTNVAGFKARPNNNAVFSLGASDYGLSGGNSLSYSGLRAGNTAAKLFDGIGLAIGTSYSITPTERLDVFGNIYTRERIIYSAYNTLAPANTQNDKTGKVERYWSGAFDNTGSSTEIFQESGNDGIKFRVTRSAAGFTVDASVQGTWAGDYSQDGNQYPLAAGGPWGTWTAITPIFSGANSSHEFTLTRRSNGSGNDTYPVYLIRAIINSDANNIKIIIEAWYKQ